MYSFTLVLIYYFFYLFIPENAIFAHKPLIMDATKIIELFSYTLPAIVTGGVAYFFFTSFTKNEENRRSFLLMKENQKHALPVKLQAYERMALFLERIHPSKLLLRVAPFNDNKNDYENFLIQNIEQEFEHNLAQQIYISDECWTMINTAKNTIIQSIRKTTMGENITSSHQLREVILSDLFDKQAPSTIALSFLKNEVTSLLG